MRSALIIILTLLLTRVSVGQSSLVVPDTLDWKRYYPLEIGNTWEYGGLNSFVSTIVGDTLTDDHRYFIRRDSIPAVGTLGPFIRTFFLRYDTAGTVVTLPSLEADTITVPLPFDFSRIESSDPLAHFDMRTAFGDTLYYRPPDTLFHVMGGYDEIIQIDWESVQVDALKCFREQGPLLWSGCYAADIGFLGGGNLFSSELRYAKVGGVEYGRRRYTAVEKTAVLPARLSIESIFPNPFSDRATITFRLQNSSSITVEIFNALGQRILRKHTSFQSAGLNSYELRSLEWSPGIYFVRLTTERGEQSVHSGLVHR